MSRHKIILLSTPTISGDSLIENEFEESDKRYFYIPCPQCKKMQTLELNNFRYEMDERTKTASDAWFKCINCGDRIEEYRKAWFLKRGKYISTQPGAYPGFHISQFYSPPGWRGWKEIATIYNRAVKKQDSALIKAFYNTVLGLPWLEPTSRPEWQRVRETQGNRQPGIAHKDVLIITAGVDVQADRLEVQLLGHTRIGQTHVVDYQIILGDTSLSETWDKLEAYIKKPVPTDRENVQIPISITCVDAGYRTTFVYSFIRRFLPGKKVVAIKGKDDLIVPVGRPSKPENNVLLGKQDRRGIELYPVGVSVIKERIYSDIQAKPDSETGEFPTNYVFFPELPDEYFKQLTAEESRRTYKKGREVTVWTKVFTRNESLDNFCYAVAGYYILGIQRYSVQQWDTLRDSMFPAEHGGQKVILDAAGKLPTIRKQVKKSDFWGE